METLRTCSLAFVASLVFVLAMVSMQFLASCSTAPRTTTPEERATALTAVALIETGVSVAWVAKKLSDADKELALTQIASLRSDIAASETVPVSLDTFLLRATNLSIQWLTRDVTKDKPPAAPPPAK